VQQALQQALHQAMNSIQQLQLDEALLLWSLQPDPLLLLLLHVWHKFAA
jgi:hypothetical protein